MMPIADRTASAKIGWHAATEKRRQKDAFYNLYGWKGLR